MEQSRNNLSIYLHWPFCRSKCPYCDFFSRVKKNIDQDAIIDDYLAQLQSYKEMLPSRQIISIFFGGGTPSLIGPNNINRLLEKINKLWGIDKDTEISLEANPNTNAPTLFTDLHQAGINRLSLGVQSLDDDELKFLGRTHSSTDAIKAIEQITQIFANHSTDLMYALPEQTPDKWQAQLQQICSFGLKHISLYQLTIEENTIFYRQGIKPANEEIATLMYQQTESFLGAFGYDKYEVSNYALPNYHSRHNCVYWQGDDYIGIGETAHGRLRKDGKIYAQTNPLQLEELAPNERAQELIIMGLRLSSGINKQHFQEICGLDFDQFINQSFKQQALSTGLLSETSTHLTATNEGFLLLDYLISNLCC